MFLLSLSSRHWTSNEILPRHFAWSCGHNALPLIDIFAAICYSSVSRHRSCEYFYDICRHSCACVCVYMCVRFMLDKANYSFIINKQQTIVIQTWALSNSFDFGPLSWLVERTILMCADTLRYIHICTYAWMYVHTFMAHKVNCGRHMHMHVWTYVHTYLCVLSGCTHVHNLIMYVSIFENLKYTYFILYSFSWP